MKILLYTLGLIILLSSSCSKDDDQIVQNEGDGRTTITFDATFGSQDFVLNKDFTSGTKSFNFTKFRYWISGVTLVNSKGEEYKVPNSYFLLEETSELPVQEGAFTYPATKRESIELKNIPFGDYKTIKFSVGVDSKYNDNLSLQAGELSQLNGMTNISWMWMTSYIFTSIGGKVSEGSGATLTTKSIRVETGLNANYKSVSLDLPSAVQISSSKETKIVLKADVEKAIDGVDIVNNPIVGASKAAIMTSVATNYSTKVFTVSSVN
ncbi:MbnP family protein [Pedobacter sp. GR22-6]|uniref:MbnP family protein n=1 Tax=Pedobacter sp. GR22-6 TaxID=3127957 RepID=UPI00307EAA69